MDIVLSNSNEVAIIDDEDVYRISKGTWSLNSNGYAVRTQRCGGGKKHSILMHREILGLLYGDGITIDHIDNNKLNNSKSNLRKCEHSQNVVNVGKYRSGTSRFKGVYRKPGYKKWYAYINKDSKRYHLGRFDSEIDAASAYNKAALELHGEFAVLNKEDGMIL